MTRPPTILLSAWRNPSVRYLLYSGVLARLLEAGARVVVLLRDQDLKFYRERLEGSGVVCEPVLLDQALGQLKGTRLGRWLLLAHTTLAARDRGQVNRTIEARAYLHGQGAGHGWRYKLIDGSAMSLARMAGGSLALRRWLLKLEKRLFPGHYYDPYFAKHHPDLLVTSSVGYSIDPFLMRAAHRHRVPIAAVVHSWDNPTTKGYRAAEPDWVIAWNQVNAQELAAFQDISPQRIFVEGVAHWDYYFDGSLSPRPWEDFCAALGLDPARKLILYGSSAPKNFPRTFDALEWLASGLAQERFGAPAQMLVRLHPAYFETKQSGRVLDAYQTRMEAIERESGGLVRFAHPSIRGLAAGVDLPKDDLLELAETLGHSDVLLTEYSTLMIEAALLDLPVINVSLFNFRDTERPASFFETYAHLRPVLETGACKNAYTFEELNNYLTNYINHPESDAAQREALAELMVPVNRGSAGQAVASRILSLAQGKG
ncbi:MAG: CDP-glycerol glycerophosphotransferase family protein [Desulfarculaceae bacterium]|nr:CDP-glycerol glycerophosphotransferase family protein [Desulfarculaceae bacterium]MCF8072110.1 CDP-glycerol glycerophosphotransferase family protein [Desulfarculaceae bacterium]MCF8100031.1 CDP-glycerol glycerophosphotransferase family protein [Desulfarculaceae bacterium]